VSCTLLHFHTIQQPQMGEWRGITSPRHSASRWLTAHWKVDHQMNRRLLFRSISSSDALPCHLHVEVLWQNYSDAMLRRCIGSFGAEGLFAKTSLLVSSKPSDGPTLPLMASVHLVLKASSWCVSVLIQTKRRIDWRCPLSDRQIIWCYCLCCSSAIHPAHLGIGPSVHPTVTS
jgi:hypothetical protein